jgi:signal transduction histidine kinase
LRGPSLTGRLIAGVLVAELACAAALSGLAIWREESERRQTFNIMLRGRADSVLGAVQDAEDPNDSVFVDPTELVVPQKDAYAVLSPSGRDLGHSPGATPEMVAALEQPRRNGYFNLQVDHRRYHGLRFVGMRVIDRDDTKGGLRRPVVVLYASPTHELWVSALESARYSVETTAVVLAVTALLLAWFLRRSLGPLRDLADAADRVSVRSWEFMPPQSALRTAELAPMAVSIRALLTGLRTAFERERQFTGDAAHELKTSLAVLKSSLQLLTMRNRTAEQYQRGLDRLLEDMERMEEVVEGMLSLARLEEAPPEMTERVDLDPIVRSVVKTLEPLAESRAVQIQIRTEVGTEVQMSREDARVMSSNLILNAVQHSPPRSAIAVSVQRQGAEAELSVTDQGAGISREALPHIFQRFYRADASRSRSSGGAGLGLAICKAIADRCNGSITIESHEGEGTRVQVRLPLPE